MSGQLSLLIIWRLKEQHCCTVCQAPAAACLCLRACLERSDDAVRAQLVVAHTRKCILQFASQKSTWCHLLPEGLCLLLAH